MFRHKEIHMGISYIEVFAFRMLAQSAFSFVLNINI